MYQATSNKTVIEISTVNKEKDFFLSNDDFRISMLLYYFPLYL